MSILGNIPHQWLRPPGVDYDLNYQNLKNWIFTCKFKHCIVTWRYKRAPHRTLEIDEEGVRHQSIDFDIGWHVSLETLTAAYVNHEEYVVDEIQRSKEIKVEIYFSWRKADGSEPKERWRHFTIKR